ncbi:MAG: hypothetical protein IRZ23_05865 [Acetobacteraceae bacterium]|nr:hypothetical protein [Acetobacteraceae bacterium]
MSTKPGPHSLTAARWLDRITVCDVLSEAPNNYVGSGRNALKLLAIGLQCQDRRPQFAAFSGDCRQKRANIRFHAACRGRIDLGIDCDSATRAVSVSCRRRHQAFVSSRHATARAAAAKSGAKPVAAWMLKYRSSSHSAADAICQPAAV